MELMASVLFDTVRAFMGSVFVGFIRSIVS